MDKCGYRLLARNYRSRHGEIDLVCIKDGIIVFIEVKARRSDRYGSGLESVTARKIARIRHVALEYLEQYPIANREIRFDVINVLWHDEEHQSLEHIPAAF